MTPIGIDPGQTGACVALEADGVTVAWSREWRRQRVPPELPIQAGDVVALEEAYLGRSARSYRSLVLWRDRLQLPEGVTLLEPLPSVWRARVLRATGRRGAAKALALAAACLHGRGLPDPLTDHAAEAWCLARYAWGWARREGT